MKQTNTNNQSSTPNKSFFQRIYSFFDQLMPFQNANEFSYIRVKSTIAVLVGIMVFLFLSFEIFSGYSFLVKADIIKPISLIKEDKKPTLAIVEIDSAITIEMSKNFEIEMEKIRKDKSIKSVLIVFNSGGGSPAASDDMAHYIEYFKETKPVYSYIQSVCASGAYYIASASDRIYANPTSIVGSIGVVLPHYNGADLAKTIGIEEDYIAAGKHKVPLSLMKKMTDKDRVYLQTHLLDPTYKAFKDYVAKMRHLDKETIDNIAEGIIYVSSMKEVKGILVDETISLIELKNSIKKNISNKFNIKFKDVTEKSYSAKPTEKKGLLGLEVNVGSQQLNHILTSNTSLSLGK